MRSIRCPTLAELPPPQPGKTGWPWTEGSAQLSDRMLDGREWPTICLVTPSYNQGRFIEETIRSVLLQGYPNLQYAVVDGGSADASIDVIKKYSPWLAYWVSETDRGQTDAINKGLAKVSGDWANWINSDDRLNPSALGAVGRLAALANSRIQALVFACNIVDEAGIRILETWRPRKPESAASFLGAQPVQVTPQPSTFIRKPDLVLDDRYHYVMDWTLYLRLADAYGDCFLEGSECIASFRMQSASKTTCDSDKFAIEAMDFVRGYHFSDLCIRGQAVRWLAMMQSQLEITRWQLTRSSVVTDLFRLLLSRPKVLTKRFFWGALRRKLLSRTSAPTEELPPIN